MPSRITLNANGGPEVLRQEQVPAPQPGPGEGWVGQAANGVHTQDHRPPAGGV
ncbi:quinone oxidoreductase, partial [Pseudomonas aeruginosa]|nr:quinone oxidoreductase [Pseudomonas aeruginosa]